MIFIGLVATSIGLVAQTPSDIVTIEYGFDEFPAIGKGNKIVVASPLPNKTTTELLALSGLDYGIHKLFLRTMNRNGQWSHTYETNIQVCDLRQANISKVAYSFKSQFGNSDETVVDWPASGNLSVPLTNLTTGLHLLCIRVRDNWGRWSLASEQIVCLTNGKTLVKGFVYHFTGTDFTSPSYTVLANLPAENLSLELYTQPGLLEIGKSYTLQISAIDTEGHTGPSQSLSFTYKGLALGIGSPKQNNVVVFPNPATTEIQVVSDQTGSMNYKIYDMHGRLKQHGSIENGKIILQNLPKGKYLILFEIGVNQYTSNILIE